MVSQNNKSRVVVTGLGIISSIGIGWQEFWKNLIAGRSGIIRIECSDNYHLESKYAGPVRNFDLEQFFGNRRMSYIGRTSQMALAATKLALADAHLKYEELMNYRVGVSIGTTMGEPQLLEVMDNVMVVKGPEQIDVQMLPIYPSNVISSSVARNLGAKGDNFLSASACSAGNYSIGRSFDDIFLGRCDIMVAGGADSFSRMNLAGFGRMLAVATEKCQPFDKNRKGMLIGEGAGIIIIESLESAKKRGAPIYAEILGYGLSCDAHSMTAPNVNGIKKAINKAMASCNVRPQDVDYICAHGTGTEQNDKNEAQAVKDIFYRNGHKTPMSSVKSMLGHTMGAASAIEGIVCCLAIKHNMIPPTINHETPDSGCDIDCVPNSSREKEVNLVLNNSFAFGGNNASIVFKEISNG